MTSRVRRSFAALLVLSLPVAIAAAPAERSVTPSAAAAIGRAPTVAELRAWDIDVRADFKGLPPGSGSVEQGAKIWEARCSSCHGDFGESNSVFTPLVGGTTKHDIESGRSAALLGASGYPHRTTLMKLSKLSTLWDYVHRAMPWNEPKSLAPNDVYAVLAYLLNLGDIVPAEFVLSDRNVAEVEAKLPNRDGHVVYEPMWKSRGAGDVRNALCMRDCGGAVEITSALPIGARNANGNIAEQTRGFGAARGTDTSLPPSTDPVGSRRFAAVTAPAPASAPARAVATAHAAAASASAVNVAFAVPVACTGCHDAKRKIVGPAWHDVAAKYADQADAAQYLSAKILRGGSGVWGPIPMPPQTQLSEVDAAAIARWLVGGAK